VNDEGRWRKRKSVRSRSRQECQKSKGQRISCAAKMYVPVPSITPLGETSRGVLYCIYCIVFVVMYLYLLYCIVFIVFIRRVVRE
jgi:hypothetical protein